MINFKNYIWIFVFPLILVSCEPEVTFKEPQPSGVDQVQKLKRKFIGEYLCLSDSSVLKITKSSIVQYWYFVVDIDSTNNMEKLEKGIHVTTDKDNLTITISTDSSNYAVDYHKNLFSFENDQVAKHVGGTYFLSYKVDQNSWEVITMSFDTEGYLVLHDLDLSKEHIVALKEITEVSEETDVDGKVIEYQMKPSKKELDKIMASTLFEPGEKFVRLKK